MRAAPVLPVDVGSCPPVPTREKERRSRGWKRRPLPRGWSRGRSQPSDLTSPSVEGLKNQPNRGPKLVILPEIRGAQNLRLSRSHCHKCELNMVAKRWGQVYELFRNCTHLHYKKCWKLILQFNIFFRTHFLHKIIIISDNLCPKCAFWIWNHIWIGLFF